MADLVGRLVSSTDGAGEGRTGGLHHDTLGGFAAPDPGDDLVARQAAQHDGDLLDPLGRRVGGPLRRVPGEPGELDGDRPCPAGIVAAAPATGLAARCLRPNGGSRGRSDPGARRQPRIRPAIAASKSKSHDAFQTGSTSASSSWSSPRSRHHVVGVLMARAQVEARRAEQPGRLADVECGVVAGTEQVAVGRR